MDGKHGGSDPIERLLRAALPRQRPPSLSLESILERQAASARRGRFAAGALVLALVVGGLFAASRQDTEPPVHLNLRVVDAAPGETGLSTLENAPRELRGP